MAKRSSPVSDDNYSYDSEEFSEDFLKELDRTERMSTQPTAPATSTPPEAAKRRARREFSASPQPLTPSRLRINPKTTLRGKDLARNSENRRAPAESLPAAPEIDAPMNEPAAPASILPDDSLDAAPGVGIASSRSQSPSVTAPPSVPHNLFPGSLDAPSILPTSRSSSAQPTASNGSGWQPHHVPACGPPLEPASRELSEARLTDPDSKRKPGSYDEFLKAGDFQDLASLLPPAPPLSSSSVSNSPVFKVIPPTPDAPAANPVPTISSEMDMAKNMMTMDEADDDSWMDTPRQSPKGRLSNEVLDTLDKGISDLDALIKEISDSTGLAPDQVISRWQPGGSREVNYWNIYQRYFADPDYIRTERKRIPQNVRPAFGAQIPKKLINMAWIAFQSAEPEHIAILKLWKRMDDIRSSNTSLNMHVQQFKRYCKRLQRMAESASTVYGFETVFCTVGSVIHQDQGLSETFTSESVPNFFSERLHLSEDLLEGHLKAHAYDKISRMMPARDHSTDGSVDAEEDPSHISSTSATSAAASKNANTTSRIESNSPALSHAGSNKVVANGKGKGDRELEELKRRLFELTKPCGISELRKSNVQWKRLANTLATSGWRLENWPEDVPFPCDTNSGKGIAGLSVCYRGPLLASFDHPRYPLRVVRISQTAIPASDPVIIGAPPPPGSQHTHGRRVKLDGTGDRLGPPRQNPQSTKTVSNQKLAASGDDSVNPRGRKRRIVVSEDREVDEADTIEPTPKKMVILPPQVADANDSDDSFHPDSPTAKKRADRDSVDDDDVPLAEATPKMTRRRAKGLAPKTNANAGKAVKGKGSNPKVIKSSKAGPTDNQEGGLAKADDSPREAQPSNRTGEESRPPGHPKSSSTIPFKRSLDDGTSSEDRTKSLAEELFPSSPDPSIQATAAKKSKQNTPIQESSESGQAYNQQAIESAPLQRAAHGHCSGPPDSARIPPSTSGWYPVPPEFAPRAAGHWYSGPPEGGPIPPATVHWPSQHHIAEDNSSTSLSDHDGAERSSGIAPPLVSKSLPFQFAGYGHDGPQWPLMPPGPYPYHPGHSGGYTGGPSGYDAQDPNRYPPHNVHPGGYPPHPQWPPHAFQLYQMAPGAQGGLKPGPSSKKDQ
ncbi:hypothetical protein BDZ97DRAFT_2073144 [Flammula alnicola]|nr:hypothetical protein BDZ97DRAFT_2073144 [Flammula alnicola]